MGQLRALQDRLRQSLWLLPAVFASFAALLAFVLTQVDQELSRDPGALWFMFGGTAEGARSVLSTIAQSMLTFTGLVFSITMLVLQLASTQLSPRVMRTFLRDLSNQVVLGLFVATFVFTLLVLRDVRSEFDGGDRFVPGLSIWVAFTLLLASIAAFIYYIDHMAHAIRASTVIHNIWAETRDAIERLTTEDGEPNAHEFRPDGPPDAMASAAEAGVIFALDEDALVEAAREADGVVRFTVGVGDFVPEGAPLAELWGSWGESGVDAVRGAVNTARERSLVQDVAFGFRQLVDVAIRALSPGTNDPSTAVQAIDRIHDLLRRLVARPGPQSVRRDESGAARVILRVPDWEDYAHLAIDEIRLSGRSSLQVNRRLRDLLEDLMSVAPPDRKGVLRDLLNRLDTSAEDAFTDRKDVADARRPSARGHALTSRPGRTRAP